MSSINEVSILDIGRLSADQLTTLLHKLLHIEASKNSLDRPEISVPEKITVADGGEDGRIRWTGYPSETQHLKNRFTIFQNKATDLSPRNCKEEILEKELEGQPRKLKSKVEEVVISDGCYVLFTNRDLNQNEKKKREDKFREAIQEANHRNHATFQILIYDSNYIKNWTNEDVATITYVQSCVGITRASMFRTWNEWKRDMNGSEIPFQTNEVILGNMNQIRRELTTGSVIRVIGHSGLGKTRLVLETFRENSDDPEIKALQSQLVYYDIGMGSLENITSYILSHKNNQSGIIVIDNCDENAHSTISGLVRSSGGFKIITIDFSSETSEKSVIRIDRDNQRDIIKKIVDEKFKNNLTKTNKDFIANQSEGYPQMAILFSDSVNAEGIDRFNSFLHEDFLKKLIFGRNNESSFDYEIIKACSVMSNFGFIDYNLRGVLRDDEIEVINKETNFVRKKICNGLGREITTKEFYTVCIKYKKSQIVEQRGTRIMVRPTPLAINLAAQWWRETPPEYIKDIFIELGNDKLGEKLVERLKELDQLDAAKGIVNELWGPNSPFSTAEVLNTSWGSLLFRYVVEVNPIATTNALIVVFDNMTKEEMLNISPGRRNLVLALEKLCFRKETFTKASRILYKFSVSENETWGNNATSQFMHLFQVYLPGTEVSLLQRLEIIEWGLKKNDEDYTRIAILTIGKGLVGSNFSRVGSAEKQGSSIPLKDYRPEWSEITQYWEKLINYLTDIACFDENFELQAKETIARSIRDLVRSGHFEFVEKSILRIIDARGNLWIDALNSLRFTIKNENFHESIVSRIENLINKLTPTDIKNKLLLKVSKPEWFITEVDDNDNCIDRPRLNAEAFAQELIDQKIPWIEYISDLLHGEQRQGFNFGCRIGELLEDKEGFVEILISALKEIRKEDQNPEFFSGFLYGSRNRVLFEKTIDRFILDEDLRQHTFYLTKSNNLNFSDIEKLFILIDTYGFSITHLRIFHYGSALDKLTSNEITQLCIRINKYGNVGKWTSISILYMYCLGREENWKSNAELFKTLLGSNNLSANDELNENLDLHHWSDATSRLLKIEKDDKFAISITKQIIEFCSQNDSYVPFGSYIENVAGILFEKYFDSIWEYFAEGILNDKAFYDLKDVLGSKNGNTDRESVGIAFTNTEHNTVILEWCKKYPITAPERIARMMPFLIRENNTGSWHPFAIAIIDEFGDNLRVLHELAANMGTVSLWGSSVPYYTIQQKLFEELLNHRIETVREWASAMVEYLKKDIK